MHRAMLLACLPWLVALVVSVFVLYLLVRVSRARLQLGRLLQLHRDQAGGVQSLSFVLTLPIFIMVMMLIVQVSQLMIGFMVVHYAAFAAARSAIVWIPADLRRLDPNEGPNCISSYQPDPDVEKQVFPTMPHPATFTVGGRTFDLDNVGDGPVEGGVTYLIAPGGPKYEKIRSAAVLACMAISPSRNVGYTLDSSPALLGASAPPGATTATDAGLILKDAYLTMSPESASIPAVPGRLANKLAYSLHNTSIKINFYHQNFEPPLKMTSDGSPLGPYLLNPEQDEFAVNEVGRQDLVIVKVTHKFALLPGLGRLLSKSVSLLTGKPDKVSSSIHENGTVYYYSISTSAALNVEGEKSVIPYVY